MKLVSNWWFNDDESVVTPYVTAFENKWPGRFEQVATLLDSKDVFIDIGANYGFVSYHMSKIFKEVHSFELIPNTYECLKKNSENIPNIKTYPYGLGNKETTLPAYLKKNSAGVSQILNDPEHYKYVQSSEDFIVYENLPIRTLDSFNFTKVDVIKIDVEGFEDSVLEGSIETINRCEPAIILEITPKNHTKIVSENKSIDMLENLGYTLINKPNNKDDYIFVK